MSTVKTTTFRAEFRVKGKEKWEEHFGSVPRDMLISEARMSETNIRRCIEERWDVGGRLEWRIIKTVTEEEVEVVAMVPRKEAIKPEPAPCLAAPSDPSLSDPWGDERWG